MFSQIDEIHSARSEIDVAQNANLLPVWLVLGSRILFWGYVLFVIWMCVECLRRDPERWWLLIILMLHPFGVFVYFFARWLPAVQPRPPRLLQNFARGDEIRRLQAAARQIGNAYQFIELGDALREVGRFEQSIEAYTAALEKESDSVQALWGAALVELEQQRFSEAQERLEKLLQIDPEYKFGDVSLTYAKALFAAQQIDSAAEHLQKHIKRWRHPEALYLLAQIQVETGQLDQARQHLLGMLLDISGSPKAIARKRGVWKSRAEKLLRKLPP